MWGGERARNLCLELLDVDNGQHSPLCEEGGERGKARQRRDDDGLPKSGKTNYEGWSRRSERAGDQNWIDSVLQGKKKKKKRKKLIKRLIEQNSWPRAPFPLGFNNFAFLLSLLFLSSFLLCPFPSSSSPSASFVTLPFKRPLPFCPVSLRSHYSLSILFFFLYNLFHSSFLLYLFGPPHLSTPVSQTHAY